ncbi:MAG: radical SAM protein, partial [Oligoflexia bacterium]|nr:radical SAM protein [Oligoflexia bacterium]
HDFDNIFQELEDIKKYGFETIFIGDDTFACNHERTINFCNEYINRKINLPWTSNLRVADVDLDRLKMMKKAGAYRVFVGFESFNSTTMDAYNKNISFENSLKAANIIRSAGLEIHGSFMIGGPGDTKESLLAMIPLIKKLNPTIVTFNKVFAWSGTAFGKDPEKFGLYYTEDEFWFERDSWANRHPFYTKTMTPEDVNDVAKELYFEFLS